MMRLALSALQRFPFRLVLLALASCLCIPAVYAERLELSTGAPAWAHYGAALLLYSHIAGGALGLLTGLTASLTTKGGAVHRASGKVFFGAMFVSYVIGAAVAPFLMEGQRPNFVAGILALYLLITGVMAAKRRKFVARRADYIGLIVALSITAMGAFFIVIASSSESGTVDGAPPQAFYLFVVAGLAAAIGDLRLIVKGSLSHRARVTRHLWRMCVSFFFASASLFLGQPQVFPQGFTESWLPVFLAFFPILVMVGYLLKNRINQIRP